jgi:hypothetical protein
MGHRSTSQSKFLDSVQGQSAPRAAPDADPVEGGPAIEDQKVRQDALKLSPQPSPFINAVPKFSTGPRSRQRSFPTKTTDERKAP